MPFGPELKEGDWPGRPWEEAIIYRLDTGAFTKDGTFIAASEKLEHIAGLGFTAVELAPCADDSYGRREDLKNLVQNAHLRGLMLFMEMDYVPEDFFVRDALHRIDEYGVDGICVSSRGMGADEAGVDALARLAKAVRNRSGAGKEMHLVLKDGAEAGLLERDESQRPRLFTARLNHDLNIAAVNMLSRENGERGMAGHEVSAAEFGTYLCGWRIIGANGAVWPETSISFLGIRPHDGLSVEALRVMMTNLSLAPSPPMILMGQEFGLFDSYDAAARNVMDWTASGTREGKRWLDFFRSAIRARKAEIIPRAKAMRGVRPEIHIMGRRALAVHWPLDRGELALVSNMSGEDAYCPELPEGDPVLESEEGVYAELTRGIMAPWTAVWILDAEGVNKKR